jgi:hypothetical protein
MKIKENRMRSFVERGNELITNGKTPEAMKLVERGLGYYTDRIMKSLSPYAKADAGLIFPLWQYGNCEENGNRELEVIGNIFDNLELAGY